MSIYMDDLRDIAGGGYPVLDLVADEIEDLEKAYALLFEENAKLKAEVERLRAALAGGKDADSRTCTCHPDDNPPQPCPRKFSLTECRDAAPALPAEGQPK